jgi:Flp pilus assembly protein TadD
MVKANRLGVTLTAIGLVGALAGCATVDQKYAMRGKTIFGTKVDTANIGLATRAQLALAANDVQGAIPLAERAVENSPKDAGFRALLGNVYLAAGRFASAEAAYSDSLALLDTQPQVALKLALVQTAQGRNAEALAVLTSAQKMLDPADLGLAVALAGRPDQAVQVMEPAARAQGADARLRQNLALAYALAGNWDMARTVTEQDVPGDQVDARIQQFMALAKPGKSGAAVASFIGVSPAATDTGQPIRLALNKEAAKQRMAEAVAPRVAPVAPAPTPVEVAVVPAAPVAVAEVAAAAPIPAPVPVPVPIDNVRKSALIAAAAPRVQTSVKVAVAPVALRQARPALSPASVRLAESIPQLRKAAIRSNGASRTVVQLGAYSSRDRIEGAWANASGKVAALRGYQPMAARFEGARGIVYRLSVKGFANNREAFALCAEVKRAGKPCFVRNESGDAPVEFASR